MLYLDDNALALARRYQALARGAQIFQKSRSCVKILGVRSVTWSKFYTEDP
jgi:hypothetical protein